MAQSDLLQEAADPATEPERLRRLADHEDVEVQRAALRNPAVPEDVWREALLEGSPEAWANPMASLYMLTWTPRENESITPEKRASWVTIALWVDPERCSPEGKALIATKLQEWWASSDSATILISFLGAWAKANGNNSAEHREVVRIVVLCVRTVPDLTDEDQQALDVLEQWSRDGAGRRAEIDALDYSESVECAVKFAQDLSFTPWRVIREVEEAFACTSDKEFVKAEAEHSRLLADLIRQEMPLPPTAD
jgi:hypothetical protein